MQRLLTNCSPWHHVSLFPLLQSNKPFTDSLHTINVSDFLFRDSTLEEKIKNRSVTDDAWMRPSMRIVNMVVEIPKFTRTKNEIMTKEEGNPIKQDIKKNGELRYLACPMYWNYGALPQTWESDREGGKITLQRNRIGLGFPGDLDPVDIVEVGDTPLKVGDILQVKVFGCFALLDNNEIDYKVIGLRTTDSRCQKIDTINDLENSFPQIAVGIREWFRWYKYPETKKLGTFGFDEKIIDAKSTAKIILETHCEWRRLLIDKPKQFWIPVLTDKN